MPPSLNDLPRRVHRALGEEGNGWRQSIEVEIEGVRYANADAAGAALGIPYSTVNYRCRSERFPAWIRLGNRVVEKARSEVAAPPEEPIEPAPWAFDGGRTRRPSLDPNFNPPRVLGHVGWVKCLKCWSWCWSRDVVKQRRCCDCGGTAGMPKTMAELKDCGRPDSASEGPADLSP